MESGIISSVPKQQYTLEIDWELHQMITDEIGLAYDHLSREDQARYLVNLAHDITLTIRGCYSDRAQIVNSHADSRVGNLNEILHRVIGCLSLVLDNTIDRPSGKSLIDGLLVWTKNGQIEAELIYSLQTVMAHIG